MRITTSSNQETKKIAEKFASTLNGGNVVGLIGDLGAGKTEFTKGLARGLGVNETITSPTFVIMKVYLAQKGKIKQLVHIDAYRLKTTNELMKIGATEYFNDQETVTVIEWADTIRNILPPNTVYINLKHIDKHKRSIII